MPPRAGGSDTSTSLHPLQPGHRRASRCVGTGVGAQGWGRGSCRARSPHRARGRRRPGRSGRVLLPPSLVVGRQQASVALAGWGESVPLGNDPAPSGSSQPSWMRTCSRRTFSCLFCPLPSHSPLPRGAGRSLTGCGRRREDPRPQRVSKGSDGFGLCGDPWGGVRSCVLSVLWAGLFQEGRVTLCSVSLFLKGM